MGLSDMLRMRRTVWSCRSLISACDSSERGEVVLNVAIQRSAYDGTSDRLLATMRWNANGSKFTFLCYVSAMKQALSNHGCGYLLICLLHVESSSGRRCLSIRLQSFTNEVRYACSVRRDRHLGNTVQLLHRKLQKTT